MTRFRVLVSDPLSEEGLSILKGAKDVDVVVETKLDRDALRARLNEVDAVVVRSGTKITADLLEGNTRLKVIGRAGAGVDNVDVPAATARGIVVMNTPGGNSVTTAEHTLALMFAAARRVPQGYHKLKGGEWDRKLVGTELAGKTLGLIGAGNIGGIVADRARGLKMRVIAYDPFLSEERARQAGIDLRSDIQEVIREADVLSVHVPLNDKTKGLIGEAQLKSMKKSAILINCARGGIVDEAALDAALKAGTIAAAALDVFEQEPPPASHPLLQNPNVVYTPHLGASTHEAQLNVAIQVAEQVVDFLSRGEVRNAVNAPSVSAEMMAKLGPHLMLGEKLGRLTAQLHEGALEKAVVQFHGEIAAENIAPVLARVLKGILTYAVDAPVNEVNARDVAKQRGIAIETTTNAQSEDYASSVTVTLRGGGKQVSATGAVFGKRDARIVRLNEYLLETLPAQGQFILLTNKDVPGVIGKVGTLFGQSGVNIAQMHVGRSGAPDGMALTVVALDKPIDEAIVAKLRDFAEIVSVRQVTL